MTALLSTETLDALLESALAEGFFRIGQIHITSLDTGFSLCHVDDLEREGLEKFVKASDAIALALYDDAGKYRPLKSAPTLRHGWRLDLKSLRELRLALDLFYPAAIGNWRSSLSEKLTAVPLRDTLNRQTGMYRVTGKLTDEQSAEVVRHLCQPGCLRSILWSPFINNPPLPFSEKQIPLLCCEACNLFVASARKVVKGIPLDQSDDDTQ